MFTIREWKVLLAVLRGRNEYANELPWESWIVDDLFLDLWVICYPQHPLSLAPCYLLEFKFWWMILGACWTLTWQIVFHCSPYAPSRYTRYKFTHISNETEVERAFPPLGNNRGARKKGGRRLHNRIKSEKHNKSWWIENVNWIAEEKVIKSKIEWYFFALSSPCQNVESIIILQ